MKYKYVKQKILVTLLILLVICCLANYAIAKEKNDNSSVIVSNDREPRIIVDVANKDFLIVKFHDEEGISIKKTSVLFDKKKINIELIESSDGAYTNTGKSIKDIKGKDKYSGKRYDYGIKIKRSNLTTDYKYITINTYDYRENCYLKESFQAKTLKGSEDGKWYITDIAPRVSTKIINNNLNIYAKDNCGIKSIKVLSNKTNEEIYSFFASNTSKKSQTKVITSNGKTYPTEIVEEISMLNLEKARTDDNKYKVKVISEDFCGVKNEKTMIITLKSDIKEKSISLAKKTIALDVNKKELLNVEWNPPIVSDRSIKWESSNKNVAEVNTNGYVKGIGKGEAIITATSANGKKSSCKVKVSELEMKIDVIGHSNNSQGWGDAVIVNSENDYLLMDLYSYSGQDDIIKYLKKNNIKKFDVYISHYDPDHIGIINGEEKNKNTFKYLLNNYEIGTVYLPYKDISKGKINSTFYDLITYVEESNKIKKNKTEIVCLNSAIGNGKYKSKKTGNKYQITNKFKIGSCTAKVIFGPYSDAKDENEASLVTMIKNNSGNIKYLTAGDIDKKVEKTMIDRNMNLKADIFKCNHHGAYTSNSYDFIKAVNPDYYFINFIYYVENKNNIKHFKQIDSKIWQRDRIKDTINNLRYSNGFATSYNGQIEFQIYNTGEIRAKVERNNHIESINVGKDKDGNSIIEKYNFCKDKKIIISEKMKKSIRNKYSK